MQIYTFWRVSGEHSNCIYCKHVIHTLFIHSLLVWLCRAEPNCYRCMLLAQCCKYKLRLHVCITLPSVPSLCLTCPHRQDYAYTCCRLPLVLWLVSLCCIATELLNAASRESCLLTGPLQMLQPFTGPAQLAILPC